MKNMDTDLVCIGVERFCENRQIVADLLSKHGII